MKQKFTESGIEFLFNEEWVVKKYDGHPYYKKISGLNMKGVDFIGIYKGESLVFMEVKNYRIRYLGKTLQGLYDVFDTPKQLAKKVLKNFNDSKNGILVINNFLSNNWLLKPILPLFKKIPLMKWKKNDTLFWLHCQQLIERNQLTNILLLETNDKYPDYPHIDIRQFRKNLASHIKPAMLVNIKQHPFRGSLKIVILK